MIHSYGWLPDIPDQRDYLYVPNLHGTDWPRMKQMYGQLLPYAMHRADLNYLIDNMGSEIAIGHSYVRGGDMPDVPQPLGGLLGGGRAGGHGEAQPRAEIGGGDGDRARPADHDLRPRQHRLDDAHRDAAVGACERQEKNRFAHGSRLTAEQMSS